jgi:hypothetical protein
MKENGKEECWENGSRKRFCDGGKENGLEGEDGGRKMEIWGGYKLERITNDRLFEAEMPITILFFEGII